MKNDDTDEKEKMLIQYIRNSMKRPIGVVVALSKDKIGFSLCNPKDNWNKKIGLQIAKARAKKYGNPIVYMDCHDNFSSMSYKLYEPLERVLGAMNTRAEKYYN